MKQVIIARHGGPECLELREGSDPEPGPGQLRIRVRAAGVNFADILGRMGLYPDAPKGAYVPGYEVSGAIDKLGEGVERKRGERVMSFTRFGGYSDLVCVSAEQAVEIPEAMSFEEAAAIPVQYLTAYHMVIRLGNLRAGETIFVHGLGGGVGMAALQLARQAGGVVLGTSSPSKHEALLASGAAKVFGYDLRDLAQAVREATGGRGVQQVLDPVGGRMFRTSYRMLAPTGRLFLYGFSSLAPGRRRNIFHVLLELVRTPSFRPIPLMNQNRGVIGVNLGHLWNQERLLREEMEEILRLYEEGHVKPVIAQCFPLAEAVSAHRFIQDRRNIGKVLLTVA